MSTFGLCARLQKGGKRERARLQTTFGRHPLCLSRAGLSTLVELRSICLALVTAFDDQALTALCSSCSLLEKLNLNATGVSTASGLALLGFSVKELSLAHTR